MSTLLAYTPFLDPLPLHDWWWWTIIPMAFGVSVAYKAVRLADLRDFWRQALVMTVQIVGTLIGLAAGAFVLIELIATRLG
ncbi:MAG: hypothetical protein AAGD00_00590 [Planctomycetota bacterium]